MRFLKTKIILGVLAVQMFYICVPSFAQAELCSNLISKNTSTSKIDYFRYSKRADAYGMTSPFTVEGKLNGEFAPDVLYTWMKPEFLENIMSTSSPKALLPTLDRPFYSWRTPVGSFGYGDVSIRMKLKAGVKFALIPHIHRSDVDYEKKFQALKKAYDLDNTVFVSEIPIAGLHEYTFFSGKVLHSLSEGTPEHLEEITREAQWIFDHDNYQDFDLIFKISPADTVHGGTGATSANLTSPIIFDFINWSRESLALRIEEMKKMVTKQPAGVIVFSEGLVPNRDEHFRSKLKPYWKP